MPGKGSRLELMKLRRAGGTITVELRWLAARLSDADFSVTTWLHASLRTASIHWDYVTRQIMRYAVCGKPGLSNREP